MNPIFNELNGMSVNELIYLFIDGEATDIEKSILFSELSQNSTLQQEFQDALNIKNAVFVETSNIVLPVAVTNSLLIKAGICNTTPVKAPITQKITGLLSKTAMISLSSGIVGALFTLFLLNLTQNSITQNNKVKDSKASLKNYVAIQYKDSILQQNVITENDKIYPIKSSEISKYKNFKNESINKKDFSSGNLHNEDIIVKQNPIISTKFVNDNSFDLNNKKFKNKVEFQKTLQIPSNDYKIDDENSIQNPIQSNFLKGFTIMLNSINGLKYYPNRDNIYAQSVEINNLALTIKYKLDDTYSIGITVGKENYPLFIKSKSGDLYPNSTINYYGLNCDINLYDFDFAGDLSTDLRILACGTSIGFLGKSGIGFVWSPDSKLGFNFGLESTISVSSFYNNADITGKLGLYYGISYKF